MALAPILLYYTSRVLYTNDLVGTIRTLRRNSFCDFVNREIGQLPFVKCYRTF